MLGLLQSPICFGLKLFIYQRTKIMKERDSYKKKGFQCPRSHNLYSVSDDSFLAFTNNCLFRETLATIILCIYNLDGPMLINSDEIVDVISDRKKNLLIPCQGQGQGQNFSTYKRGRYVRTPTIYGLRATCIPSSHRWLNNR